jgi:hypothetical protein
MCKSLLNFEFRYVKIFEIVFCHNLAKTDVDIFIIIRRIQFGQIPFEFSEVGRRGEKFEIVFYFL